MLVPSWSATRSPTARPGAPDGTLRFPDQASALDWLSRVEADAIDRAALRRLLLRVCPLASTTGLTEHELWSVLARELVRRTLVVQVEPREPLVSYQRPEPQPESVGTPLAAAPIIERGLSVQVLPLATPKALSASVVTTHAHKAVRASVVSTNNHKALSASIVPPAHTPEPVATTPAGE